MNSDTPRQISAHGTRKAAATDEATQDFVSFYQTGKPRVFYHALALVGDRAVAEDLTQDAFLRLLAEIKCGNPIQSALKWTNRVLRNLALNYIAHAHVVSRTIQADVEVVQDILPHRGPSIEQELIAQERRDVLGQMLERLAPLERECLLMFAEGYSYQQIADRQQMSYGVTVATIRRALRRVRKMLATRGH